MTTKLLIDCKQLNSLLKSHICIERSTNTKLERYDIKYTSIALEVHEDAILDKTILDIRTYICTTGKCNLHYNRSHRRMSSYNWQKIENSKEIEKISEVIINAWKLEVEGKQTSKNTNNRELEVQCDYYCDHGDKRSKKHIHFVKESKEEVKKDKEQKHY